MALAFYFCFGRLTSPSVCLERGRWDWGSLCNFHGAIAIAKFIPCSNWGFTAPPLRVLQGLDTAPAPLEFFDIPSITPVCKSKVPHFFLLLDAKDALTMIARFMNQIMFRGEFRVAWGTVCHQDAFATMLVGREHTFQSITSARKSHERYYPTPPNPQPLT